MVGDVDARVLFGTEADVGHGGDRLNREVTGGGFGGEHHRIGAIQHGVGDIHDFGAGRQRCLDHGFHHLGGGDHHAVEATGGTDQLLLHPHQLGVTDFDAQVTPGDHHHIRSHDDIFHGFVGGDGFGPLDLGDDLGVAASFTRQLSSVVQIGTGAREGDGQVIYAHQSRGLDVFLVFVGQRRSGEATAFLVDPLVVGQGTCHRDGGIDASAFDALDQQLHAAIVQQQQIAGNDVLGQGLVVDPDLLLIAFPLAQRGIQYELVTEGEENLAVFEGRDPDLGPLQIAQNGDVLAEAGGQLTNLFGPQDMILSTAVGEVHAHHVGARLDDPFEDARTVGGRAHGGHDLGSS